LFFSWFQGICWEVIIQYAASQPAGNLLKIPPQKRPALCESPFDVSLVEFKGKIITNEKFIRQERVDRRPGLQHCLSTYLEFHSFIQEGKQNETEKARGS
jgi:hypothetical protein